MHPEAAPRTVGFPRWSHSVNTQASVPAAAAMWVETKACTERPSAASALPALNPNHPNQSNPAPSTVIGRLFGAMLSVPKPLRFPTTRAAESAETPAVMCTTVPPAKSIAPRFRSHPPIPHIQCATGL